MRKLDCLIISTARAASTAVYQYVNERGALGLPTNKEPHYWCDVQSYQGRYDLLDTLFIDTREEYVALYDKSELMIDASVGYFFYIDQVIRQLVKEGQRPKVVFLYREPLSRANSLYNELRKKGLEHAKSSIEAVQQQRRDGLWWEHYYDNVCYAKVFDSMKSYFSEILSINYAAFQGNPHAVVNHIMDYLGIKSVINISYRPVNSSAEAKLQTTLHHLRPLIRLFPSTLRRYVVDMIVRTPKKNLGLDQDLAAFLPISVREYSEFQNIINHKDICYVSRDCS